MKASNHIADEITPDIRKGAHAVAESRDANPRCPRSPLQLLARYATAVPKRQARHGDQRCRTRRSLVNGDDDAHTRTHNDPIYTQLPSCAFEQTQGSSADKPTVGPASSSPCSMQPAQTRVRSTVGSGEASATLGLLIPLYPDPRAFHQPTLADSVVDLTDRRQHECVTAH